MDTSEEKARLTRLIETIQALRQTKEWHALQELHFMSEEDRIKRLLLNEAKTSVPELAELYRLQGELKWAERYADIDKWVQLLSHQLRNL